MKNSNISTPGGRLQYILNQYNLTQTNFAEKIGTTKATINRIISNKVEPSRKIIENIKINFPEINVNWLEKNIGTSGIENELRLSKEKEYIERINELLNEIERLKLENNQLKIRLYEKAV